MGRTVSDDETFIPFADDESDNIEMDLNSALGNGSDDSPLSVVSGEYCPDSTENVIKKIEPAKWESLISILELLTKDSDDQVIIENSIITHNLNGAIIRADLNRAFDDEKITLHISSPKKWVRLFKQFKNDSVFIIDEPQKNCFIVTNGEIRLFLPKQLNNSIAELFIPEMDNTQIVSQIELNKDVRDKILNIAKGTQYIEYLIQDQNIKCINIPNTAMYVFPQFIKDEKIKKLDETTADITLRTSVFSPIPSDKYTIIIGRKNEDNTYFSFSKCDLGLINIELYENLDDASGGGLFI